MQIAISVAPENGALRKKRSSMSGSTAPRLVQDQARQRQRGQRERAHGLRRGPARMRALDDRVRQRRQRHDHQQLSTGSIRRGRCARDSGTYSAVSTTAARPIGTLIQKIARQPTLSVQRAAHDRAQRQADAHHRAPRRSRGRARGGP